MVPGEGGTSHADTYHGVVPNGAGACADHLRGTANRRQHRRYQLARGALSVLGMVLSAVGADAAGTKIARRKHSAHIQGVEQVHSVHLHVLTKPGSNPVLRTIICCLLGALTDHNRRLWRRARPRDRCAVGLGNRATVGSHYIDMQLDKGPQSIVHKPSLSLRLRATGMGGSGGSHSCDFICAPSPLAVVFHWRRILFPAAVAYCCGCCGCY